MENQITSNELLARMLECFDFTNQRIMKLEERVERFELQVTGRLDRLEARVHALEKKVDDNYVELSNRMDEIELKIDLICAEQRSMREEVNSMHEEMKVMREEQKVIHVKVDERVAQLEIWRNSYQR